MIAKLSDGRTVECHYQCDIKGYQPGGTNWKLGKGKPPLNEITDLWDEYKKLWVEYFRIHPYYLDELKSILPDYNYTLSDCFASSNISQARAIAEILNNN